MGGLSNDLFEGIEPLLVLTDAHESLLSRLSLDEDWEKIVLEVANSASTLPMMEIDMQMQILWRHEAEKRIEREKMLK